MNENCRVCMNVSGEKSLFPKGRVYEDSQFYIEHVYLPTGVIGWFVVVPKAHFSALHELSVSLFQKMWRLVGCLVESLKEHVESDREYIMVFGEKEGFKHVHVHVIPIVDKRIPKRFRGSKIFGLMRPESPLIVSPNKILNLCEKVRSDLKYWHV